MQILHKYLWGLPRRLFTYSLDGLMLPVLLLLALLSRANKKKYSIGLGPEPLINNVYHKRALAQAGYTARTFVNGVYYITDQFDVRFDLSCRGILRCFRDYWAFINALFCYRCLYIYFNGGPLGGRPWLWQLEPWLLKLAGIKTVVMPYGSDVQDMTRTDNLLFKHAQSADYPSLRLNRKKIAAKIDLWTEKGDHIISGCDWVEYTPYWDTLMLAHFSLDTNDILPISPQENIALPLRILHAPNHRNIKGTKFFEQAVEELCQEGIPVELIVLQRCSNEEIKRAIAEADVIADQLIIGWYAMFALEAMAMGKPVLSYIRRDFEDLYIAAGLIVRNEIPIINSNPENVKEQIKYLALHRAKLKTIGEKSREYVVKHHSLNSVGKVFAGINQKLGIPADSTEQRV